MADIEGVQELLAKLEDLGSLVTGKKIIARAVRAGSNIIRDEAERLAPRATGKLADNIIVVVSEQTANEAVGKIGPSKRVFYGLFQELGTAFHPARPFLQPAWDAKIEEATEAMRDRLKEEIEEVAKG